MISIFIVLLAFLAILWFLDEILTVNDIRKYGLRAEKNPIIRKFAKEGGYTLLYFKIISYAVFFVSALVIYTVSDVFFYVVVTSAIIIYGIMDYRNLDLLEKR